MVPEEDPNEIYNLDLDDETDDDEREAAIREAVKAVEEAGVGSKRHHDDGGQAVTAEVISQTVTTEEEPGEEVLQLRQELEETRERALRTLADFENYRKRTEREREEVRVQAMAEPLKSFLEVGDNLERALQSRGSNEDLRIGVEMILRQVKEVNRDFGVEEIEAVGCAFDPGVHDAVARQEDPAVAVPTVAEEFQRGYLYRGRLLRPARVMVAVPPERKASHGQDSVTGSVDSGDQD